MNKQTTRSLSLALIMIAAAFLPLLSAQIDPAELQENRDSAYAPPSPCLGADACRGYDSGVNPADQINLTEDFDWIDGPETNSYSGQINASGYAYSTEDGTDVYKIDMKPGYGVTMELSWYNGSSFSFMGSIGYLGEVTASWSSGAMYGYNSQNSNPDSITFSTSADPGCDAAYTYGACDSNWDLMGEVISLGVSCYYCSSTLANNPDYTMNITVFPADGGAAGDTETPMMNPLLSMPDEPSSWSYQSDTFTLDGSQEALVAITSCDSWCPSESSLDITLPDGTVDSFGYWANGFSGIIANYSDAGEYTVEKMDSFGDGGFGLDVGISIGNFSGFLTGDMFTLEDAASGHVNQTDTMDVYAVSVPENFYSNITVSWDADADLDVWLYSDSELTTLFDYSASYDNPEFIDNGQTQGGQMFFVVVEYYSASTASHAGYLIELGLAPGSPPPCWFQDDAWSGNDAGDSSSDALNVDGTGVTTFSGMVCQGYDDVDYFEITVPAYHGLWAVLDWGYENESMKEDGQLMLYQYMDMGYSAFVSSSTGSWGMQAVATNESYSWNNAISSDSTLWLGVMVSNLPEDYEMNYTISYSIYNATEEPIDSQYQNDGLFDDFTDAGDDYATAMELIPMNQTFEGYGHDSFDSYDYYKIYMPNNYAMQVSVSFPEWNDIDIALLYQNPNWGWYSTISSSYNDNPEVVSANYDYADQDVYLRVQTDRGSGDYEVTITMWTPGLDPGSTQDDCGTGMDMDAPYFAGGTNGNEGSWANESTSAGLNPDDPTNHTGGVCEGWLDTGWDRYDVYHIPVPVGSYVMLNLTVLTPGTYVYAYMTMCQIQHEDCSGTNPMYYAGPLCGYTTYDGGVCESNSGLWPVGQTNINGQNGWITMYIYTFSSNVTYEMDITFPPLSELEGGVQNDANSGQDAGPGIFTAVHVNDFLNASQTDMLTNDSVLEWEGWSMAGLDSTDRYSFDVPANSGVDIFLDCGYDIPDRWCILDIFNSAGGQIAGSYYTSGYQQYNTTSQASNLDSTLMVNMRNWGTYDDEGTNYTFTVTFYTLDSDGDGWWDGVENDCGTDPNDSNSTPSDYDGDGLCDSLDDDIDNDGVPNNEDAMDFDNTSSADMDGDGVSDQDDDDIDGDGWTNYQEQLCLGDSYNGTDNPEAWEDASIVPNDTDGDTLCDLIEGVSVWDNDPLGYVDTDSDNDGVNDLDANGNMLDQFPLDDTEWDDTDGDRIGNNADMDDDGDGYNDTVEIDCLSDPLMSTSQPVDSDGDTICNALDDDNDNDGYNNSIDWDEFNPLEWMDSDGDGYGDNADMDDDNDGWWDSCEEIDWMNASAIQLIYNFDNNATMPSNCPGQVDAFPYDSTEWEDTDGDGTGDNADTNDDGDAWSDADEMDCGSDAYNPASVPDDYDGDGVCDTVDTDDDGDGINDVDDAFPTDAGEQYDLDGDGIGDEADTDMDGDGWLNDDETGCLTDPMDAFDVPSDNDGDYSVLGVQACDINDPDDDNDLVPDPLDPTNPQFGEDFFPTDRTESVDTDGDGIGDNADNDDDGDGWLDITEKLCAANGGRGDSKKASEMPEDSDWNPGADGEHGTEDDFAQGDGICDALDPDTDGDGFPDPMNPLAPLAWEDHFPDDNTEWYDANGDGFGDNGVKPTILDDVSADPLPFVGVLVAIVALGVGLTRMANTGSKEEEIEGDYTDEFEDFDFEDDDLDMEESEDGDDDADDSDDDEEMED
jgi:hypothetical protein